VAAEASAVRRAVRGYEEEKGASRSMELSTGIALAALAISGGTFVRQLYRDRWEKKRHVVVEGKSAIVATPSGERVEIIGMRGDEP
jgi:hypothetical protein